MTTPDPTEHEQHPSVDGTPTLPWHRPELRRFGAVNRVTAGLSYRPLDGISNLSP